MFDRLLNAKKTLTFAFAMSVVLASTAGEAAPRCEQIFDLPSAELVQKMQALNPYLKVSYDFYQAYEVNDIAKALIARIHKQETEFQLEISEVKLNLQKNSDIILFFSVTNISSILQKGFLNQHQTQLSGGYLTPVLRRRVENTLAGCAAFWPGYYCR